MKWWGLDLLLHLASFNESPSRFPWCGSFWCALYTHFPPPTNPSKLSPTLTACAKTFFIIAPDSSVIRLNSLTFDRNSQQSTVSMFQCFSVSILFLVFGGEFQLRPSLIGIVFVISLWLVMNPMILWPCDSISASIRVPTHYVVLIKWLSLMALECGKII